MAMEALWTGTVPVNRLYLLRQISGIIDGNGGAHRLTISNGSSEPDDLLLIECCIGLPNDATVIEIRPDALFQRFRSDVLMADYLFPGTFDLSTSLDELLKPPHAAITFTLTSPNNVITLVKEKGRRTRSVTRTIQLGVPTLRPRPTSVVLANNLHVQPSMFPTLYDFLASAQPSETGRITFGEDSLVAAKGMYYQTGFESRVALPPVDIVRNSDVIPAPALLDIREVVKMYGGLYPLLPPEPLVYFGDIQVVVVLRGDNDVVYAKVVYTTQNLHYVGAPEEMPEMDEDDGFGQDGFGQDVTDSCSTGPSSSDSQNRNSFENEYPDEGEDEVPSKGKRYKK